MQYEIVFKSDIHVILAFLKVLLLLLKLLCRKGLLVLVQRLSVYS
jgi:hypothetical protein